MDEEIDRNLEKIIEAIKEEYSFLSIDKNLFDSFVSKSKEIQIKNEKDYKRTFTRNVVAYLNKYIRYLFKELNQFDKISKKFIEQNVIDSNEYSDCTKSLKKVASFFRNISYTPTPDELINLVKNKKMARALQVIVGKHLNTIKKNRIDILFDEELSNELIETYCMVNDIEMDANNNIDEEYRNASESFSSYLGEIRNIPILSEEEEKILAYKILDGDEEARKKLINSNLKLVISIAKKYASVYLPLEDLIQEGCLGLMIAVDKFDVKLGFRFSTYATTWIRQTILKAVYNKGRVIRIPCHLYDKIGKYKKVESELFEKLNREPTVKEVSDALGISLEEGTKLYILQNDATSLDTVVGDGDEATFGDFVKSDGETPEQTIIENSLGDSVKHLFKQCDLSERERNIVILRFGLDGNKRRTLEEIGKSFGMTKERVRQIEARSLRKLRAWYKRINLYVYMDNPDKLKNNIEMYAPYTKSKAPEYKKSKTFNR